MSECVTSSLQKMQQSLLIQPRTSISLKETEVMGQDVDSPPSISISDHELDVIHNFVYLGFTISDSLSLDTELNKPISTAATTTSTLTESVDQRQAE